MLFCVPHVKHPLLVYQQFHSQLSVEAYVHYTTYAEWFFSFLLEKYIRCNEKNVQSQTQNPQNIPQNM